MTPENAIHLAVIASAAAATEGELAAARWQAAAAWEWQPRGASISTSPRVRAAADRGALAYRARASVPAKWRILRRGAVNGVVGQLGDMALVALEGTGGPGDILADLLALPARVRYAGLRGLGHRGLYRAGRIWASLAGPGLEKLGTIIVGGHSAGVAGLYMAAALAQHGHEVWTVTFGAPPMAGRRLGESIAVALGDRLIHVRHPSDPVPRLGLGAWHHPPGKVLTIGDGYAWGVEEYRRRKRQALREAGWWYRLTWPARWGKHGMMATYYDAAAGRGIADGTDVVSLPV